MYSPDVVCGRVVFKSLIRFDSQLKRCQESRRTPFDIRPLTPSEENHNLGLFQSFIEDNKESLNQ